MGKQDNELAMAAKKGTDEDLLELWEAVKSFAGWLAHRWLVLFGGAGGVTRDDLLQAAFLGMLAAVRSYQPEEGPFLPLFRACAERAFSEWSCCRTPKQRRDPLHRALSLDEPISADDPGGAVLGDLISSGRDEREEAEDRLFRAEISEAVRAAIGQLPVDQARTISLHFFGGLTMAKVAELTGTSWGTAAGRERRAFSRLRRRPDMIDLARELNLFHPVGVKQFRRTHTSSTERDALALLVNMEGGRPTRALPPIQRA